MKSIGVGVFIKKDYFFLIGQRSFKCKYGSGCYALPGGMVEDHETIEQAAVREVYEETGLLVEPYKINHNIHDVVQGFLGLTDASKLNLKADLTFWMVVQYLSGDPKIREPDKCLSWDWVTMGTLEGMLTIKNKYSLTQKEQNFWTPINLWRQIYPYSR